MKDDTVLPDSERMDNFHDELCAVLKKYKPRAAVVQVDMPGDIIATFWYPGCGPDCDNPGDCAAHNFRIAAHKLNDAAQNIDNKNVRVQTPVKYAN